MKEWALKHPILTFLLVDGLITGVLKTISAFSPRAKDGKENDAVEMTVEVPEIEVEVEDKEETK